MLPHDYGEIPDLHNIGEGAAYVEPDYWANDACDQLPLLSTMGRGPRGVGLYVGNVKSTSDEVSFGLYSDDTGELVWQSPNLAPAQISFKSTDWQDVVPGVAADLDITVAQGGATETYTAYLPAGQPGSLIYLLAIEQTRSKDDTYTVSVDELTIYGKADYPSKPVPRANDIVFFKYKTDGEYGFAFGTIEAVEKGQATFTARTFIPIPPVTIGSNGNWYIDGKDTKVQAKGEKGDKGDKGDTGAKGAQGEKGDKGNKGEQGKAATVSVNSTKQLDPGASAYVTNSGTNNAAKLDFGIPEGKPAKLASLTVKNLEPGEEAYGEAKVHSSNENSYDITLGIPRGEDGKTFDVKNGWWTIDDLPEFDETPINTVYVVEDEDGTHHFYIRGRIAYDAELGGPWTVVDVMNYDNLNDVPLKLIDGKWVSQRGGILPVEWGVRGGTRASMGGSKSTGVCAHAEGNSAIASGDYSHAEGLATIAQGRNQHVQGKFNIGDDAFAFIVGGGTSDIHRKNIHTLDWSGNADYAGNIVSHDTQGTAHSLNAKANKADLATVATTGSYNDLKDTPNIFTIVDGKVCAVYDDGKD